MFAQEGHRKFQRDELMVFAATARTGKARSALVIESGRRGGKGEGAAARLNFALAGQVQTNFECAGMKTARPIEITLECEVMPLNAESAFLETAVERSPAVANPDPSGRFAEARRAGARVRAGSVGCGWT